MKETPRVSTLLEIKLAEWHLGEVVHTESGLEREPVVPCRGSAWPVHLPRQEQLWTSHNSKLLNLFHANLELSLNLSILFRLFPLFALLVRSSHPQWLQFCSDSTSVVCSWFGWVSILQNVVFFPSSAESCCDPQAGFCLQSLGFWEKLHKADVFLQ